ncbi:MBL fold metallo-hydrolase [uncultured Psychroserpens sp.]|uniref:MBL fold metallo-hydrolase n=1 Tax=uncultured Psychroserpens sp. TaxID=255436 RepID=UPI00262DDBC8|nr:MBL fold metallo-hydrolase [uncultured Psychroserpens sp.]
MKLTIHGYSTALFATWYFIEELGLLLDAGDGLTSNLLGKTGKIKHVFISHADRDHLGGLLQYNQLFSHRRPHIYYPKDANSFRFLEDFTGRFDPHTSGTIWTPLEDEQMIDIKTNYKVQGFENKHIDVPGQLKSLSYKVIETKNKLKPEFAKLSSHDIVALKKEKGDGYINEQLQKNVLIYSADTPVFDYSKFDNCDVLIHEATFLKKDELEKGNDRNKHSSLEDVMEMVANISVGQLILGHFSSRYDSSEIDKSIKKLIAHYNIKIPVFRIPIGEVSRDILNGNPLN